MGRCNGGIFCSTVGETSWRLSYRRAISEEETRNDVYTARNPAAKMGTAHKGALHMPEPTEKEIMERAYQIWEREGKPENRESEFWHLAQQELRNEDKSNPMRTPDTL
jgi:hypothetical protein